MCARPSTIDMISACMTVRDSHDHVEWGDSCVLPFQQPAGGWQRVLAPDGSPPIVVCPGFGNNTEDYTAPFGAADAAFVTALRARGFSVYVVPVQRKDWFRAWPRVGLVCMKSGEARSRRAAVPKWHGARSYVAGWCEERCHKCGVAGSWRMEGHVSKRLSTAASRRAHTSY
eukprot:325803-Chlamydomonas_euryale.AAC.1